MVSTIIRAILDDPTPERGRFVDLNAPLSAMAYVIAAIAVQGTQAVDRAAIKKFVRDVMHTIEQNIRTMRESGNTMPLQTGFRTDQMH